MIKFETNIKPYLALKRLKHLDKKNICPHMKQFQRRIKFKFPVSSNIHGVTTKFKSFVFLNLYFPTFSTRLWN